MKTYLLIDTSKNNGLVAVIQEKIVLAHALIEGKDQSKTLLPTIDSLLQKCHLTLNDLHCIAVCIGPGTFTGTRVGVITAKAIAFARNLPIATFSSLAPTLERKEEECGLSLIASHLEQVINNQEFTPNHSLEVLYSQTL